MRLDLLFTVAFPANVYIYAVGVFLLGLALGYSLFRHDARRLWREWRVARAEEASLTPPDGTCERPGVEEERRGGG